MRRVIGPCSISCVNHICRSSRVLHLVNFFREIRSWFCCNNATAAHDSDDEHSCFCIHRSSNSANLVFNIHDTVTDKAAAQQDLLLALMFA